MNNGFYCWLFSMHYIYFAGGSKQTQQNNTQRMRERDNKSSSKNNINTLNFARGLCKLLSASRKVLRKRNVKMN